MSKKYMLNTLITIAGYSGECPPNNSPLECGFYGDCHECWLEWVREQLLNELGIEAESGNELGIDDDTSSNRNEHDNNVNDSFSKG